MINYKTYSLDNGLQVIYNEDKSTPLVAVNLLYKVGAKHEKENATGFAHLFEHLMFSGSRNCADFDTQIENMCGESNAFTNNDYTNFYLVLPSVFLSEALHIEADRMANLILSEQKLNVQKNVVIEEFNQRYLNQPYGDLWQKIRVLCYEHHPYKWQTIGKDISHIANADLQQAKDFYAAFYMPSNAILSISGNVSFEQTKLLCQETFGNLKYTTPKAVSYEAEPIWKESKTMSVKAAVPTNVIVIAFQMPCRSDRDYYTYDLISDILSSGKSSRMYNSLVVKQKLFTEINAYISGDDDQGLFVVMGKYHDNVPIKEGEKAIWQELKAMAEGSMSDMELQKVKNKNESTATFSNLKALDRAMNLAYFAHLNDLELINTERNHYNAITQEQIKTTASTMFNHGKSRTLYYCNLQTDVN
jgi:predicted Zn-dependent peptidase